MTRRKVKLAYIVNPSDRKASYKKRKRGFMKKVQELSTLCGIDAAAVLYGPYDDKPEVWPEDPAALDRILTRFKQVPPPEKAKRMVNQEAFTQQRIEKLKEQLKKIQKENREMEIGCFITKCLAGEVIPEMLEPSDAKDVAVVLQRNIKEITKRIAYLKENGPGGGVGAALQVGGGHQQGGGGGAAPQIGGGGHHQGGGFFPPTTLPAEDMSMMMLLMHPQMGGVIGDACGVGSSSVVAAAPPPPPPQVATEMMPVNNDIYHHYHQMQNYGYFDAGWPYSNNPYQQQMMPQPSTVNYLSNAGPSYSRGGAGSSYGGAGPSYINNGNFDPNWFNMKNNNGAGGSGFGGAGGVA